MHNGGAYMRVGAWGDPQLDVFKTLVPGKRAVKCECLGGVEERQLQFAVTLVPEGLTGPGL